jgi:hypothetical protein
MDHFFFPIPDVAWPSRNFDRWNIAARSCTTRHRVLCHTNHRNRFCLCVDR